ncbi:MAG: SpoIIIAH-like family protein [Bacillota bacterium]
MQLKKQNIVILSMILLLFVIGYAYNMFTSSRYIGSDLDIGLQGEEYNTFDISVDESGGDNQAVDETHNMTAAENADSADYNPFEQTSSVAVVENPEQNAQEAIGTAKSASAAFFAEYRLEREKNRSREVEMWEDIINSQNTEKTFKEMAQNELVKIVALTEKEMIIEKLIISRGFNDALVFITDDSATVIVETKELNQQQVAQIQDIVVRKTKLDPSAIKIMTKN